MIATSTSSPSQIATQTLQNSLPTALQATDVSQKSGAVLSQVAINEFALRFNAAMFEMLTRQGVSNASPLGKKLKAYATEGVAPTTASSRFV